MHTRTDVTAVVIDDDPDVRHMLVQVFEAAGFRTTALGGGVEGLQAVLDTRPLIASVDLRMPGIDGFEVVRRIREAGLDTHIIVITASREEVDVVLGLNAGADELVHKPLRVRELRARIEAVLRRANALASATPPAPTTLHAVDGAAATPSSPAPVAVAVAETIAYGSLVLSPADSAVRVGELSARLDDAEVALLATLMRSGQLTRSTADLALVLRSLPLASPHRPGDDETPDVDGYVAGLRRKLGDSGAKARFIEPVQPIGYRMVAEH